jgi:predicted metalloprotease
MRLWTVTFYGRGVLNPEIGPRAGVMVRAWSRRGATRRAVRRARRMTLRSDWSSVHVHRARRGA